jgi:hypothetical protein
MKDPHQDPFLYVYLPVILGVCWSMGHGSDPFMPTHGRNPALVVIKLHSLTSTEVSFR